MCKNKVVCVVNDYEVFNKVVKNNENIAECEIFDYDNTAKNISIPKRYNDFIVKNIKSDSNFWILFIHQDFGIMENIDSVLKKLNRNDIYGAVGVTFHKGLFLGKEGFKKSIALTWGRILQGQNNFNFKGHGRRILFPFTVNAIDCCCVMLHSSLFNKYNLRFDENLNFHMYAEELCYRAKKDYKIKTKVVQMKCFHMGTGTLNEEFVKSADYLKKKFNIKRIPSTCKN